MNVCEGHRARHLVVRLDRGEELPNALIRALSSFEARSAVVTGVGAFEAVEVAHYDQARRTYDRARRIDAHTEVVSLTGNVATMDGEPTIRLSGVLSRESELGLSTVGGQIVWARVFQLELHVTVLEDITLTRVADERTGLPMLEAHPRQAATPPRATAAVPSASEPAAAAAGARVASAPSVASVASGPEQSPPPAAPAPSTPIITPPPAPAAPPAAPAAPAQRTMQAGPSFNRPSTAMPQRREPEPSADDNDAEEEFPDAGDVVIHFHFGECLVVSSNGEKIRMRQDKPGSPVLDVSLLKLRIELIDRAPDGKRRFRLHRKN